jgi:predicted nucleic acid-binding protein
MIVVADAGPLIALSLIGQFELFKSLYGQIYIPPAVRDEVLASQGERPGAEEVSSASWIQVSEVRDTTAVQLVRERLDRTEIRFADY